MEDRSLVQALRGWFRSKPNQNPIEIVTKRPTLRITLPDGSESNWQYDVVPLKLKIQSIQEQSGRSTPGEQDLSDFCEFLKSQGMPACNLDVALRVWSLVIVQFQQIALSIASQVDDLCQSS